MKLACKRRMSRNAKINNLGRVAQKSLNDPSGDFACSLRMGYMGKGTECFLFRLGVAEALDIAVDLPSPF